MFIHIFLIKNINSQLHLGPKKLSCPVTETIIIQYYVQRPRKYELTAIS